MDRFKAKERAVTYKRMAHHLVLLFDMHRFTLLVFTLSRLSHSLSPSFTVIVSCLEDRRRTRGVEEPQPLIRSLISPTIQND